MAVTVTYDQATNTIEVTGGTSGTPATFADIYTADIGATNGYQLLDGTIDADPDTFSLDDQPRPGRDLAIPIKVVCTARAGATCDIAGTDAWDNAVSENGIDISSGTATTTQRFKTVDANGITVDGLQNGDDFDIFQDRWGVVHENSNIQSYYLTAYVNIGDGSTSTYFSVSVEMIYFEDGSAFDVFDNATLDVAASRISFHDDGGHVNWYGTINMANSVMDYRRDATTPEVRIWGTFSGYNIIFMGTQGTARAVFNFASTATVELERFTCHNLGRITSSATYNQFEDILLIDCGAGIRAGYDTTITGAKFDNTDLGFWLTGTVARVFTFIDTIGSYQYVQSNTHASSYGVAKNTFNLRITDKSGHDIQGATVTMTYAEVVYQGASGGKFWKCIQDSTGNTPAEGAYWTEITAASISPLGNWPIKAGATDHYQSGKTYESEGTDFSGVSTDADGNIAEQTVESTRFETTSEYETIRLHKLTVEKGGYQTLVIDNILLTEATALHLELQGVVLMDLDGNMHLRMGEEMEMRI